MRINCIKAKIDKRQKNTKYTFHEDIGVTANHI